MYCWLALGVCSSADRNKTTWRQLVSMHNLKMPQQLKSVSWQYLGLHETENNGGEISALQRNVNCLRSINDFQFN